MKRSKLIIGVVLATAVVAAMAVPASAGRGARRCGAGRGGRGMGPQFTVEQQEQMKKIHEKYNVERVELTNRLKVIGVEMGELIEADGEPDFGAIERKMEDAASVRLDLAKLRLRIHKEVRPLLTDDQKVLFDGHFGRGLMHGGRGSFGPGAMGHGGMDGGMGRGACVGMGRGGMQGCTPGGMRHGMGRQAMPGCMMGGAPLGGQPTIEEFE